MSKSRHLKEKIIIEDISESSPLILDDNSPKYSEESEISFNDQSFLREFKEKNIHSLKEAKKSINITFFNKKILYAGIYAVGSMVFAGGAIGLIYFATKVIMESGDSEYRFLDANDVICKLPFPQMNLFYYSWNNQNYISALNRTQDWVHVTSCSLLKDANEYLDCKNAFRKIDEFACKGLLDLSVNCMSQLISICQEMTKGDMFSRDEYERDISDINSSVFHASILYAISGGFGVGLIVSLILLARVLTNEKNFIETKINEDVASLLNETDDVIIDLDVRYKKKDVEAKMEFRINQPIVKDVIQKSFSKTNANFGCDADLVKYCFRFFSLSKEQAQQFTMLDRAAVAAKQTLAI